MYYQYVTSFLLTLSIFFAQPGTHVLLLDWVFTTTRKDNEWSHNAKSWEEKNIYKGISEGQGKNTLRKSFFKAE